MITWMFALLLTGAVQGPAETTAALAADAPPKETRTGRSTRGKRRQRRLRGKASKARQPPPGRQGQKRQNPAMLPNEFADLNRMLGRQQYRSLLARTREKLAAEPLNPHLHAARVVGCRHYGDYPCVDQSYEESLPSDALNFLRQLARADALHHQGAPDQAARLRRAMIIENAKPLREERLLGKLVLDLEQAGDLEGDEGGWC